MDEAARLKWNKRYAPDEYLSGLNPDPFLCDLLPSLPPGRALCLAAGEGRNAVYLAEQGYAVTAVDISVRGLEKCQQLARDRGVQVQTIEADVMEFDLTTGEFDLVTDFYFLERRLSPRIMRAVKPGGVFLLQTYSRDQLQFGWGPSNPDFLLEHNELLEAFRDYRILRYEEVVIEVEKNLGEPGAVAGRQSAVGRLLVENCWRPSSKLDSPG